MFYDFLKNVLSSRLSKQWLTGGNWDIETNPKTMSERTKRRGKTRGRAKWILWWTTQDCGKEQWDKIPAPFHFKISISRKMNTRIKSILCISTFQKRFYENRIFTIFINKKSPKAGKQCNPWSMTIVISGLINQIPYSYSSFS